MRHTKRILCLVMLFAFLLPSLSLAERDAQLETALSLASRMSALSGNITYVELFVDKQEGLDEELAMMNACADAAPVRIIRYDYLPDEKLAASIANYGIADRVDEAVEATAESILSGMNRHLPQLLMNRSGGWLWQQIADCLSVSTILEASDSLREGFLFLDYGHSCGIMVTFTGYEAGMLCEAYYVQSELFTTDFATEWLSLLWRERKE